jgi:mRNA-degrading endonuclease RelE of RelBE toxin-antitoxin system
MPVPPLEELGRSRIVSMAHAIRYSQEAVDDLKHLRPFDRTAILDQIEQVLTTHPTLESRARLKKLRDPAPTQYRLRVGDFRVFYDVEEEIVSIIRILGKEDAVAYLERG